MMRAMDYMPAIGLIGLAISLLITAIVLLVSYGVIRVAVSHGLRDHHKWMRRNPPRPASEDDWPIGN